MSSDLLKRHTLNHNGDLDPSKRLKTSQVSTRSRIARACNACAEAKLRCGPSRPCDRCRYKGIACEFPEARGQIATDGSPLDHDASSNDLLNQGNTSYPGMSAGTSLNHDEMQAASSLHQMPNIQFNQMQHSRNSVDTFATLPSLNQSNHFPTPSS
jgi:Fungal Zn(2)-Cys(6) binuclear cluster domain